MLNPFSDIDLEWQNFLHRYRDTGSTAWQVFYV